MKRLFAICLLLFFYSVHGQNRNDDITFVNGFHSAISGTGFSYHSSIEAVNESLLARATDGNSGVEWFSDTIPVTNPRKAVTLVWLAGIGSSPGFATFDLRVNDVLKFTFKADGANEWNLKSEDGYGLSFKSDRTDESGDRFGFMYLEIPAGKVISGKPVTLKVTGGNFNRTTWYMTFKFQLKNRMTLNAYPAILKSGNENKQAGIAGIMWFKKPAKAKLFIGGKLVAEPQLKFGYNQVNVMITGTETEKEVGYQVKAAGYNETGNVRVKPVRKWQVSFVQHSHTDIGYTRSQTDILAEHLRYIDYALDYCDLTDNYPDESKFRWVCEAAWAVDEYMKCRPQPQIDRLIRRVKEGRIEITGMYFNFDELPDERTLAQSLKPLSRFQKAGIEVKTAMQNDVNGIGWCMADFYSNVGVKYLNMGTHGHRALICFDVPTLFWWESPSGKRMLAWRAEHYMTGNTEFYIQGQDFARFEQKLLNYLSKLENRGYPYDMISIQHSGYLTDNSPPSILASDMIRKWNEKYEWPKLKTSLAATFFERMEKQHGSEFPVYRGAWPDWWTDGFGASAREVAATRMAQGDITAFASGLVMAASKGAKLPEQSAHQIDEVNSALLFYTEHTVGYHASVHEPYHIYTMEQRAIKESYAWEAARRAKLIGEGAMGLLQSFSAREKLPSLLVYNTLSWKRSGWFKVYIDHQIIPSETEFAITDFDGNKAKTQILEKFSDGAYWAVWVDNVPAFGFKKLVVNVNYSEKRLKKQSDEMPLVMENQWYKIDINPAKGTVSGLFDKELNRQWMDLNSKYQMGEFIYETLGNRSQMEMRKLDNYQRAPLENVQFESSYKNEIWNSVKFKASTQAAQNAGEFTFEVRLYNQVKRVDFVYFINKKMVIDPEGIYIAFPFKLEEGQLSFDVQGGEIRAGIDQIPGSSNDWNTVQNYTRLSNNSAQVVLSSPETPLFQMGGINTGRYKAGAKPETTHIFGWPMNNYWVTNFNAEQHGGFTWSYSITTSAHCGATEAAHFGWENRVPFLSRVIPGGGEGDYNHEGAFIDGWPENVLLVSAMPLPDGKGALLQVRETAGKGATLNLKNSMGKLMETEEVNAVGETIEKGQGGLKAFESKFFRIHF